MTIKPHKHEILCEQIFEDIHFIFSYMFSVRKGPLEYKLSNEIVISLISFLPIPRHQFML